MSTPTINVAPDVAIPCPIPRSVAFTVRLGRCECAAQYRGVTGFGVSKPQGTHAEACPARPIRVTCFISSKDWPSSEVADVAMVRDQNAPGLLLLPADMHRLEPIARERWALVKALVLGRAAPREPLGRPPLFTQRDAVFAALADMARAEEVQNKAYSDVVAAMGPLKAMTGSGARPSVFVLAAYVERLIEQVGRL